VGSWKEGKCWEEKKEEEGEKGMRRGEIDIEGRAQDHTLEEDE
jgi:hypothetical protein